MAIGALYGGHHSFMHDLESFFWVIFWICIHWNGPGRKNRRVKEFDDWNSEPTVTLAEIKMGQVVEDDRFDKKLKVNFSQYCKPLIPWVKELRTVTFPGGKRWLKEDRSLYSQMQAVLQKAKDESLQWWIRLFWQGRSRACNWIVLRPRSWGNRICRQIGLDLGAYIQLCLQELHYTNTNTQCLYIVTDANNGFLLVGL